MADDPVALLRSELSNLNLTAPEIDAKRDITKSHEVCYSVNSYTKYFPGVPDKYLKYCEEREINFKGTDDVVLNKTHWKLITEAIKYAEEYNTYVIHHRK